MAITRVGLTGAMTAYGTFTAKEEALVIVGEMELIGTQVVSMALTGTRVTSQSLTGTAVTSADLTGTVA